MSGNSQYDANLIPQTTGLTLGIASQRWDLNARNLDISGTITGMTNIGKVYFADQYGTELGAAINAVIAAMPSTGGTIDCRAFANTTMVAQAAISKPVTLLFGQGTITADSSLTTMFAISQTNMIIGQGWTTIFQTAAVAGSRMASFSGTALNRGSVVWRDFKATCTSQNATSVFQIADYNSGVFDMSQGGFVFDNLWLHHFNQSMVFGQSTYYVSLKDCLFTDHSSTGLSFGNSAEAEIRYCHFGNFSGPYVGQTHIALAAGASTFVIDSCGFEDDGAGGVQDISLAPISAGGGYYWITNNKFGSEGDSGATRLKINVSSGGAAIGLTIRNNHFATGGASTAIKIAGTPSYCNIDDNFFSGFATIIDDSFAPTSTVIIGGCTFKRNMLYNVGTGSQTLFTNGGRGFEQIENSYGSTEDNSSFIQTMYEAPEVRNLLTYSEAFNSWTLNSVTVTTGQADPLGGTSACLLTKQNGASNNIALGFQPTSLSRVVCSIWAKSGTASKLQVSLLNQTTGVSIQLKMLRTDTAWKRYKFSVSGLDTSKTYSFSIYPDGQDATVNTVNVFGAQVAYYDSDYLKTTGTIGSSTSFGKRFSRTMLLPNGIQADLPFGANVAGANLPIKGGQSTGTGTGGSVVIQTCPAGSSGSALNSPATVMTVANNATTWTEPTNAATFGVANVSELITLSTSGATTDSVANLLPANSLLLGVVAYVQTTIATATDWKLGDATTAGRFTAANATLTAGTTDFGKVHMTTGIASATTGMYQTAAAKLRITTTGTPSAGKVRVTVFYLPLTAPTS